MVPAEWHCNYRTV